MIHLPIVDDSGKPIKAPESWKEIKLGKWQEFSKLLVMLQDGAKQLDKDLTKMSYEEIATNYPSYIIKVVGFWAGLSDLEIAQLQYNEVLVCYNLIFNTLNPPKKDKHYQDGFKWKGVYYKAPETITDIDGNEVIAANNTFIEGIEYLQLSLMGQKVAGNEFENIAKQIAIMYRPEGEDYDEKKSAERAKIFEDLTMDIVWQVAFFLDVLRNSYTRLILRSLREEVQETTKRLINGDITTSFSPPPMASLSIWQKLKRKTFTR